MFRIENIKDNDDFVVFFKIRATIITTAIATNPGVGAGHPGI